MARTVAGRLGTTVSVAALQAVRPANLLAVELAGAAALQLGTGGGGGCNLRPWYSGLVSSLPSDQSSAQLLVDLINTYYLGDESDLLAESGATRWLRDHVGHQGRDLSVAALAPLRQLREG